MSQKLENTCFLKRNYASLQHGMFHDSQRDASRQHPETKLLILINTFIHTSMSDARRQRPAY